MTLNLMVVGVGGQGTILATKILSEVLSENFNDVKVSEVHGMSQRGGSVVTYVRAGEKVASPILSEGEADFILSFEKAEAARYSSYLKKGGKIITSVDEIMPMSVLTGAVPYPTDILKEIAKELSVTEIPAKKLALEAGNPRSVNLVLIGRFSRELNFPEEAWISALRKVGKPEFFEANQKAFLLGRKYD